MPNPKMDERLLLANIEPTTPATPDMIRNWFMCVVLDCFDRKVEREFFVEALNRLVRMVTMLRELEMGVTIGNAMVAAEPDRVPTLLQEALDGVTSKVFAERAALHAQMSLLAQCPMAEDKIS